MREELWRVLSMLMMSVSLCCSIASSPVDVVKVRLMTDKNRQLRGVFHTAKTILVNEGPMAFYKGFSMCWARVRRHLLPASHNC